MHHLRQHSRVALVVALAALTLFLAVPASASAAARPLGQGQASITLDPFFATFAMFGYPFYPLTPAIMKFSVATTPRLVMPVTGGTWNTGFSRGRFNLRGGLDYIHYTTTPLTLHQLAATAWHANVNLTTPWTASVNGTRIVALDEDLTNVHITVPTIHGHQYVRVSNIVLSYDTAFNDAFTSVFGLPIGTLPIGFGTATLQARLK
ncbi:MAG: hypothetical protein ACXVP1_03865 [Thermoleophilia bacterium]